MDTLRGQFGSLDTVDLHSDARSDWDETVHADDAPPPAIGQDERRMQVRAYNFWASQLEDRNFPSVEALDPAHLPDFAAHSVLLDFTCGIDDPRIGHLGRALADECEVDPDTIERLSQVPARSLLSRITDHYMQIIANQAPIGFEAEFVNQRGLTILYRGILLPYSSNDETIDFIQGVINWKEMADSQSCDELLLEIDQALEPQPAPRRVEPAALTDWADGPGDAFNEDAGPGCEDRLVRPAFGLDLSAAANVDIAAEEPAPANLAGWLAAARAMVHAANSSEERTRATLYDAVGRAYDFALATAAAPAEFAAMIAEAGLTMQDRAPMTPVVKLVFGADYDKTRLTEYAAVLAWAQRQGFARGALGDYLKHADGGLKAVVAAERDYRRHADDTPRVVEPQGPRKAIARRLRALELHSVDEIDPEGEEFALVMIRRTAGEVLLLGEVPDNIALLEKAARELLD